GSPFFHCGRRADTGVDCIGLILLPAQALGLTTFEPENYSPTGFHSYLLACVDECCERVDLCQPGDVLLFAVRGHPSHLAYWTGENTIIHAHQKFDRVIEEPWSEVWSRCLLSIWRWKGLSPCSKQS
nr:C40 family peptidase [Blastocatellia bacterium]